MIVTYIQARSNGEIIGSGMVQEELLHTVPKIEDAQVYAGIHADPAELVYFNGTELVSMPPKPIGEYKFDYETKQWIYDTESAISKALAKRDQLLADGPDRISPIWWASMAFEQQQQWTSYRQALLDITEQINYPEHIVWPTKPS
jgi:hypothetical protein